MNSVQQGSQASGGDSYSLSSPVVPFSLLPQDATSIISIALWIIQLQPNVRPSMQDVLPLYAAALHTLPPASADTAVQLATTLLLGSESVPDWHTLQRDLHLQQLSSVICSGVTHIEPVSSLRLLSMLIKAGADFSDIDIETVDPSSSRAISSSHISNAASAYSRTMASHLLQACVNPGIRSIGEEHYLRTVCAMLYLKVPSSQPEAFIASLCKACSDQGLISSHLLLLLPLAALLCKTPLPQDFLPRYESMLVGRIKQQHQTQLIQKPSSLGGASSPASLKQGMVELVANVGDKLLAPQLASLILQPMLQFNQPLTSPELVAVAASEWLASSSRLHRSEDSKRSELLVQASTILKTVAASQTSPHPILQEILDLLATKALQLAARVGAQRVPSSKTQQCSPEEAELLIAVGFYVRHLEFAPAPLASSQSFELELFLTPYGDLAATQGVVALEEFRLDWGQSIVAILRTVGVTSSSADAQSGLPTPTLIRISHGITMDMGSLLQTVGLNQEVRGLLAGQITAALVFVGLEKTR